MSLVLLIYILKQDDLVDLKMFCFWINRFVYLH